MLSKDTKTLEKEQLSDQLYREDLSWLGRYRLKVVGDRGLSYLLRYELVQLLFGNTSGALGFFLRRMFYRGLFLECGLSPIFGKGTSIRHPQRITLGNRVAIDENVLLDSGGREDCRMKIGDDVIVSRGCVLQAKTGSLSIGKKSDLGCYTVISSVSGIHIGESVLIAAHCYIGGAQYQSGNLDVPMMQQGIAVQDPVFIGDDVWLGAGSIVLNGVRVGKGTIVGAGAVVTKDLPEFAVAAGVPAKVLRSRKKSDKPPQQTIISDLRPLPKS